jgi:hypothetical protein
MAAPRPQSIPIFLLVRTALQQLWQQKDDVLRLGLIPALLCFAGFLYGQDDMRTLFQTLARSTPGGSPYDLLPDGVLSGIAAMSAILVAAYALVTVNWLRFVLLGPMAAVGVGLNVGRPHWTYLVCFVGLVMAGGILVRVASLPVSLLPPFIAQLVWVAILIAVLLVGARFLPFLVSLAIGQPMRLQQSWAASRGNALSLIVALALAWVPFLAAEFVISGILAVTGFAAAAPAATLFITALVQVAAWIGQAGVLATAFRQLVGVKV